ncbi:MAG: ATP-binding protein [Pseudomonadota bacterium]
MTRADGTAVSTRRRVPFFDRVERQHMLGGHATFVANPTYQRLLQAEPWVRRLIPVLAVTFLILIGFSRGVQLYENREAMLTTAQENLALVATLITQDLEEVDPRLPRQQLNERLMAALADTLPAGATRDGRTLMITSPDGYIHAEAPISSGYQGTYLADILEPTQPLLTFGERAGVVAVTMIENGELAIATVRHLPNNLGTIAIFQPKSKLLAPWRADVSLNTSIFLGTATLLVVILYAFFSQTTRADEADKIYHETYARFDTALKRGMCGLWDWDIGRGRIFWSPSMFEIIGLTPRQSLIGFGEISDLVHPDDVNLLETAERLLSKNLSHVDQIFRMRHADGNWIWVRARGQVVTHGESQAPHLVGICIDVSEQMRLAEETKTANSRLRDSIETLSEAFVLWDADKRLVVCNEKYRKLNTISREVLKPGVAYDDLLAAAPNLQSTFASCNLTSFDENGKSSEVQMANGLWLQINEARTKDGGYVSIGTDITKLKWNEERLRVREHELEASIDTLEQSEIELRDLAEMYAEQREIAETANRAKAEFMANISHEWRTPLNAIIGFSEMMRSGAFGPLGSEKYLEYCDDINESGTYMLAFINDIIDMSEIEAGTFKLDLEEFDANLVIADTVDACNNEASLMQICVTCEGPEPLPLFADRRAFKQIMHNLLTNALKFNKGGGSVTITCETDASFLTTRVSDTGIGIAPEAIDHLAKPFAQVQSQMTKNHTGSGLGLAITKSLVDMHDGTFAIDSKLGEGTTVTFKIPLKSIEKAAA